MSTSAQRNGPFEWVIPLKVLKLKTLDANSSKYFKVQLTKSVIKFPLVPTCSKSVIEALGEHIQPLFSFTAYLEQMFAHYKVT